MSYEGYIQHLCPKGHLFITDCSDHDPRCPDCGAEAVFSNDVNETNVDGWGEIPRFEWAKLQIGTDEHGPLYHAPTDVDAIRYCREHIARLKTVPPFRCGDEIYTKVAMDTGGQFIHYKLTDREREHPVDREGIPIDLKAVRKALGH